MKRILIIFACAIFLVAYQPALAGNGTGDNPGGSTDDTSPSDELNFDIFGIFESIMTQIMAGAQAYEGSGLAPSPKITDSMGCVNVDVNLPDSVSANSPFDSTLTTGSLLIYNCDTQSAQIQLAFAFTASIDNFIDTTIVFDNIFINLEAGDSVYCEFIFPVPPFNATYTFCVTAITSGGAGMTDCATMVVSGQNMPDIPYFAPGFLFQGEDCVLFMELGDSNLALIVQNLGPFGPGDTVFVVGTLVDDCGIQCTGAGGCVIDNTIDSLPSPPPPPPFEACGVLIQGANCVLFTPMGFGDTAFVLDNYGIFEVGDTVSVSGELEIGCETECTGAMGCILSNSIDTCGSSPPPPPPTFAGCGALVQGTNCVLFSPDFYGDTLFTLANYGTFGVGDSVFVEGEIYPGQDSVCVDSWGHINNIIITLCQDSIPPIFAGCGYLYEDQGCIIFQPLDQPNGYLLYNYGDFGPGDTVFVDGEVVDCGTVCNVVGCIDNPIIDSCTAPPPPTIAECGVIIETPDCPLFVPFTWFNSYFVLSDYGGYSPGDSVFVSGIISELPDTLDCSGPVGYIQVDSIGPCGGSPGPQYSGIGYLGYEGSCLVYYDLYEYYTSYVLENYGDFVAGDTVYVDGTFGVDCDFNCSDTALCLFDNTIILANPPDSIPVSDRVKEIKNVRSYPNPFNPIAIISFNIPVQSRVTLEIYNILGQKVETLIDGKILQGDQEYPWNGDRFASGIYFYRIETEYDVVTKKMILNK
ncbi:MAG TPA: T9SS type A sorting domain-containing protein [candidate division Zixibacteria bacterium]|nr:T9SS type A sorting domain-containing protein [candidate division Zixibacteria bacterium]HER00468.1 T9SS type A sorting domain-containing protein [candidate division Zixibacteria bacterium]